MRAQNALPLAYAALLSAACADADPTVQEPPDSVPAATGVIVSEPITATLVSGAKIMQGAAAAVSYISLSPQTYSQAVSARVRNVTANSPESAPIPVVEGGFDPVAIAAAANDQLEIAISDTSGAVTLLKTTVPKKKPPSIVRTTPPKGRTDVALKVVPAVVFSEPIELQSTTGEVRLTSGGAAVAAKVALAADAPWVVEVVPETSLQPLTTYELTIRAVRDLEGDRLESTETVTFTTGPALEFPGRLAFVSTRDGNPNIYVANGDGSGVSRLTSGDKPSWSPDGRRIVYQRGSTPNGPFGHGAEIRMINSDGSGDTRLTDGIEPAWSPDGTRIAFVDSAGISVINVDGSGLSRLIRHDVALRDGPGWLVTTPSWSPDGKRIAFGHAFDEYPERVFVMNADGSQARILTSTPGMEGAECNPTWSPDGQSILLWNYFVGISVADAFGTGTLQRLFFASLFEVSCLSAPVWSADGAAAVFTYFQVDAGRRDFRGRIYVMPRNIGGTPHQLIPDVAAPANPSYTDRDVAWLLRLGI